MATSKDSSGNGNGKIQENPISRSSGANLPPPGPPRESSRAEDEGVPSTDTDARTPLDVGRSYGRRGESIVRSEGKEAGRHETATTGRAERPAGKSSSRDRTTVNPHTPAKDKKS